MVNRRSTPVAVAVAVAAAAAVALLLACAAPCAAGRSAAKPKPAGRAAAAAGKPDADAIPSMDDIRRSYAEGKHQEVLRAVHRVGGLRGKAAREAAREYDACELMTMKAETHLRMNSPALAAGAFREAAELAPRGSDDAATQARAAHARAMAILLKRCKGVKYTPQTAGGGGAGASPLDVTYPAARRSAFVDLHAAEAKATAPKLAAARAEPQVDAVTEAVVALADLRALELEATGADGQATAMAHDLADSARDVIRRGVDRACHTLAVLESRCGRVVEEDLENDEPTTAVAPMLSDRTYYARLRDKLDWYRIRRRRGPSGRERAELRGLRDACRRLGGTAHTLAVLTGGDGDGDGDGDESVRGQLAGYAATAGDGVKLSDYLLNHDFSQPEVEKVADKDKREYRRRGIRPPTRLVGPPRRRPERRGLLSSQRPEAGP